jgi:FKBP-type peptidyl-prolyl cis-trans isomerase
MKLASYYLIIQSALLLLFLFNACNEVDSDWSKTEDGKIEYKVISFANSSKNASKIDYGDDLLLHVKLHKEDGTILLNSYANKKPLRITLPTKMHRNQFEDLLTFAKNGDSIVAKLRYLDAVDELSSYKNSFSGKNEVVFLSYKILDVYTLKKKNEDKEILYAFENGYTSVEAFRTERERVIKNDSLYQDLLIDAIKRNKKANLRFDLTNNGLKYSFVEKGEGSALKKADKVYFYYSAAIYEEEKVFDDIFKTGTRMKIEIGKEDKLPKMIHSAIANLKIGSKAFIFVPSDKAYGVKGSLPIVPSNADLMLYLEVVAVK